MRAPPSELDVAGLGAPRADPAWVWGPPVILLALAACILLTHSNAALFLLVNHAALGVGDMAWTRLTVLGDTAVAAALLLPLVQRRPDLLWALALAAVLTTLWVHGVKPWLALPRPPRVLPADALHLIGPAYHSQSFPSGHSATAFTVAGVLALGTASRGLRALLLLAACAVGLSRIMVGVHWPLDVLGGALVGWLAAAAGVWGARRWPWGLGPLPQRLIAALLLASALAVLAGYDTGYPQALAFQRVLAVLCLIAGAGGLMRLFRAGRRAG